MTKFAISMVAILSIFSISISAQSEEKFEKIGDLGWALTQAYATKTLGSLDAKMPAYRSVKIVIENSLAEDDSKDKYETKAFKTLAEADKWLISQETSPGLPRRVIWGLLKCRLPKCTYDIKGLLHNQMVLKSFTYGYRNGHPFIKSILLLDGN